MNDEGKAKKRMGKFYVTLNLVESDEYFKILTKMQFVPYRVEYLFDKKFECIGTSPLFRIQEPGSIVPEYDITIIKKDDDIHVIALPFFVSVKKS